MEESDLVKRLYSREKTTPEIIGAHFEELKDTLYFEGFTSCGIGMRSISGSDNYVLFHPDKGSFLTVRSYTHPPAYRVEVFSGGELKQEAFAIADRYLRDKKYSPVDDAEWLRKE